MCTIIVSPRRPYVNVTNDKSTTNKIIGQARSNQRKSTSKQLYTGNPIIREIIKILKFIG